MQIHERQSEQRHPAQINRQAHVIRGIYHQEQKRRTVESARKENERGKEQWSFTLHARKRQKTNAYRYRLSQGG